MVDAFSSSDAEESTGAKDNFIGKVVFSRVDCTCDICSKGKSSAEEKGYDIDTDFDHPAQIEPLTEYEKKQNVLGLNTSTSFGSKWMIFAGHLENIHGSFQENGVESLDDLAEMIEGNVYEWREVTFTEDEDFTWEQANNGDGATYNIGNLFGGMENPPNEMLVPVRQITDPDELAELGAEESAEVEEVDF
jgi:hypothetical protein